MVRTRFTALLIVAGMLTGCQEPPPAVVRYEPPLRMDDLEAGLTFQPNGFQLLTDDTTTGRFPCPLAIAKYVPREVDTGGELQFCPLTPLEQAWWTEQVRGVNAIRDVIFLRPLSTRPAGQGLAALCDTAARLGAPWLLVYAPNGLGPNSAQVLGVLYDTSPPRALATLHAETVVVDALALETSPYQETGDQRDRDARYQVQRRFERLLLECLHALIQRDAPPTTTQPHKWDKPLLERWWLPRP
ncbi:MAG: hypothetical protein AB1601_09610 [Planctomycetota bacterium]